MEQKKLVLTLSALLFIVSVLLGFFLGALGAPPSPGGGNVSIWAVLCLLIGATQFAFTMGFYQGAKKQQQEKKSNFKVDIVFFCICLLIGTILAIWKTRPGLYIYGIAAVIIAIGIAPLARTLGSYRGIRWQRHRSLFQQERPKDA